MKKFKYFKEIIIFNFRYLKFSSKNNFSLKINKKFKIKDYEILSEMVIDEFSILNNKYNLKNFFQILKKILFKK